MWMLDFPLAIVWVIAIAVIGIVAGLAISEARKGAAGTMDVHPALLIGITVFGTSLLGYFVTEWGPITLAEWWKPYLFRVVWQLGGAVLLAASIPLATPKSDRDTKAYLLGLAFVVIGVIMVNAPLADLVEGPLALAGKSDVEVDKTHGTRGGGHISATMTVSAPNGTKRKLDEIGLGANRLEDMLSGCKPAATVRVSYLAHTGHVLDVDCR